MNLARKQRWAFVMGALAVVAVCVMCSPAPAAPVRLDHGNSWVRIDPESPLGHDIWVVDGWNLLRRQWFWYRVDGVGGPTGEASLDTLDPAPFVFVTDTDGDTLSDNLFLRYTSPGQGLTIEVNYNLRGGTAGSRRSDLAETIRIINTATVSQTVHFYQYMDLILSAGYDTVEIPWPNTAVQWFGALRASETVVTPVPSHCEVNAAQVILDALDDSLPTTLNDQTGPITGDVAWAFQWDVTLAPDGSYLISKDKSLVPEPASVGLLGLGLLGLMARRRRT